MKRLLFLAPLIGLLLTSTAVSAATSTPAPTPGAGLTGVGLNPGHYDTNIPASRGYFIPTVAQGGSYTDYIQISNPTAKTLHVVAYAVDGITSQYSGAVYRNRTDPVIRDGAWIKLPETAVTVQPNSNFQLNFTVSVPQNAVPGDHLAGVGVEDATPPATANPQAGAGVNVVTRLVMAILVKVPGTASFHFTVSKAIVSAQPGIDNAYVIVTGTNDARLLGHPSLDVTLSGPNGYHKELNRQLDTVLPSDSVDFPFPWPDTLTDGDYSITVNASGDASTPTSWSGTYHLGKTLAGVGSNEKIVETGLSKGTIALLIAAISALVAITVFLIIWFVIILPRRRNRPALSAAERKQVSDRLRSL